MLEMSSWISSLDLGSNLVAAALLRRQYIGIDLEEKYCDHARRRL